VAEDVVLEMEQQDHSLEEKVVETADQMAAGDNQLQQIVAVAAVEQEEVLSAEAVDQAL
jgi:hypothetical protein